MSGRGNNSGLGGDANINAQNLSVSLKSAAKVSVSGSKKLSQAVYLLRNLLMKTIRYILLMTSD